VSPKRLDRVAPPSVGSEWEVKFGTSEAAKGWDDLCAQVTEKTRDAFEIMRSNPRPPADAAHYQLRDDLATREFGGRSLEQWQVKVSNSGRIWYLPDDEKHTVWIVQASMAHPKATERRSGRR
jgi:mRNA-degrading endonuclease RelE of RelBE toxin-antitoxin system